MLKIATKLSKRSLITITLGVLAVATLVSLFRQFETLESIISNNTLTTSSMNKNAATIRAARCEMHDRMISSADSVERFTVTSAHYQRTYRVHTPQDYRPNARYPVVLNFDGINGSGERMQTYSSLDSLPAITVYLDSLSGTQGFTAWQGAPYSLTGDHDVQFVRDVLKKLPEQYCVNDKRVFAVGMSNGGAFAAIAGCALGGKIKAVASVSGAYYSSCQNKEKTPSLLVIHSAADTQVPLVGGREGRLPNVENWVSEQAIARSCADTLTKVSTAEVATTTWLDCKDASTLQLVVLPGQAHGWLVLPEAGKVLQENSADNTAEYIWDFFIRTLPE